MIQLNQQGLYRDVEVIAESLVLECQVRLYSPHPKTKMVVIANTYLHSGSFAKVNSTKMAGIANQTLKTLQINPSQVLWVEYVPSQDSSGRAPVFNLLQFDWQSGEARNPVRVPIYEDWNLSWLESELQCHQSV